MHQNSVITSPNASENSVVGVHLAKDEFFPKQFNCSTNLFKYIRKFVKCISKLFASVIILFVLASFAPELREEVPSLYRLVDALLDYIEWIYSTFWNFIDSFLM